MKFFKDHSYEIVKLFVNQIGMTIFGLVVTFASAMADTSLQSSFTLAVSIFSLCFYLYLVYVAVWDMGASDAVRVECGRISADLSFGLKLMAFAQIPNVFFALLLWLGVAFGGGFGGILHTIGRLAAQMLEAPYLGIAMRFIDTHTISWVNAAFYSLTILPPLAVAWGGYFLGLKDVRFLTSPQKHKDN